MLRHKVVTFALICCTLVAGSFSAYAAQRSQKLTGLELQKMQTAAMGRVGIDLTTTGRLQSIGLVPFSADDLPRSLVDHVPLQELLKVVYDSVRIWESDVRMHSVAALINPGNGNVLQVTAVRYESEARSAPKTTLDTGEARLLNRRFCFAGFPDSQFTSFVSMIRNCPMNAPTARRITAVYAIDSCAESGQSEPMWFVALTGTRPLPKRGFPGVPDSLLNQGPTAFWVLMDGRSGMPIRSGNQ